jgi:hypothetical protein
LPDVTYQYLVNTNLWACNKPASSSSQICIILAVNTCHLLKCCKRTSTLVTHHEIHTNMTLNVQGITGQQHYSKVCNARSIMNAPTAVSCYMKPNWRVVYLAATMRRKPKQHNNGSMKPADHNMFATIHHKSCQKVIDSYMCQC